MPPRIVEGHESLCCSQEDGLEAWDVVATQFFVLVLIREDGASARFFFNRSHADVCRPRHCSAELHAGVRRIAEDCDYGVPGLATGTSRSSCAGWLSFTTRQAGRSQQSAS
jgi:hypothetical protein